jgi:glycosyltransferase involved in cell wall biosynthesis
MPDADLKDTVTTVASRRIALVADELLGYVRNGLGTTTTFLAVALGRMGHHVEVVYLGPVPEGPIDPEWQGLYDEAGVTVRPVPRGDQAVEPSYFARMWDVERALRADPPDVVVVQDLSAPAYTALRLRRLGLAFQRTSFVVLCHGTRQWITDVGRKVRVLPGALAIGVLERASVELADAVVCPSSYLVDWMRAQGWRVPDRTFVVPHPTRSAATGEPEAPATDGPRGERVERLAFFGRLEERKGVRPFVAALNTLEPRLLGEVDVEFLARPTPSWSPTDVESLLTEEARRSLRSLAFETELDQHQALERLRRPGTLAVMPSFAETFGNTVRECLEHGIPFIASNAAALQELVAADDRDRVLFEPTTEGTAAALRRALSNGDALRPARPAVDGDAPLRGWAEVVALEGRPVPVSGGVPSVDVVVVPRGVQSVEAARVEALAGLHAEWVVFLDEEDVPEPALVETLIRAQAASGADVVSCGLALDGGSTVQLFPGEPRGLGVVANGYGSVALVRRSLLDDVRPAWPVEGDPDWVLLATLSARGARIVSVPLPLVARRARPGTIETHPTDALLVVEQLERILPDDARGLARLGAGLVAAGGGSQAVPSGLGVRAVRAARRRFRGAS